MPGMFSMAQRVELGALALPGQCQTPRTGSGVCQSTGAAAEPSPPSPSPAGADHTPRVWGAQLNSISFTIGIAEFVMLLLFLQSKPSRDNRMVSVNRRGSFISEFSFWAPNSSFSVTQQ